MKYEIKVRMACSGIKFDLQYILESIADDCSKCIYKNDVVNEFYYKNAVNQIEIVKEEVDVEFVQKSPHINDKDKEALSYILDFEKYLTAADGIDKVKLDNLIAVVLGNKNELRIPNI